MNFRFKFLHAGGIFLRFHACAGKSEVNFHHVQKKKTRSNILYCGLFCADSASEKAENQPPEVLAENKDTLWLVPVCV